MSRNYLYIFIITFVVLSGFSFLFHRFLLFFPLNFVPEKYRKFSGATFQVMVLETV